MKLSYALVLLPCVLGAAIDRRNYCPYKAKSFVDTVSPGPRAAFNPIQQTQNSSLPLTVRQPSTPGRGTARRKPRRRYGRRRTKVHGLRLRRRARRRPRHRGTVAALRHNNRRPHAADAGPAGLAAHQRHVSLLRHDLTVPHLVSPPSETAEAVRLTGLP